MTLSYLVSSIIPTIIVTVYVLISMFLFLYYRNHEPIKNRLWLLVCISFIWIIPQVWTEVFMYTEYKMSCVWIVFIYSLSFVMWLTVYFIRALFIYFQYQFNYLKLQRDEDARNKFFYRHGRLLTSPLCVYSFYIFIFIITAIMYFLQSYTQEVKPPSDTGGGNCLVGLFALDTFWAIVYVLMSVIGMVLLWNKSDGFSMRRELLIFVLAYIVLFISWAVVNFLPRPPWGFQPIFLCGLVVSSIISLNYPVYLARTGYWIKVSDSESSLNSTNASKSDLFKLCLENDIIREDFKKFSASIWCAENIQFYTILQAYKKASNDEEAKKIGEVLIRQYIEENSPSQINIDYDERIAILSGWNNGSVDRSLFNKAEHNVLNQMRTDTFEKFKNSGELEKSYLKMKVSNEVESGGGGTKLSDLAMELIIDNPN